MVSVQAVQLRLRAAGQNRVANHRIRVYDANGLNPVDLIVFPSDVANSAQGATILVATADFEALTGLTADFLMDNPIPASYLAAGRLAFENLSGTVFWAVTWGGSGYQGNFDVALTNDADGMIAPAFDGPLPSDSDTALLFSGLATDLSVNSQADYQVTSGPATFTANDNSSAPLVSPVIFTNSFEDP